MEMTITMPIPTSAAIPKASSKSSGDKPGGGAFGDILGQTLDNISTSDEKDTSTYNGIPQSLISNLFVFLQPSLSVSKTEDSTTTNTSLPQSLAASITPTDVFPLVNTNPSLLSAYNQRAQNVPQKTIMTDGLPQLTSETNTPFLNAGLVPDVTDQTAVIPASVDLSAIGKEPVDPFIKVLQIKEEVTVQAGSHSQNHMIRFSQQGPLQELSQEPSIKSVEVKENTAVQNSKAAEASVGNNGSKVTATLELSTSNDWQSKDSEQPVESQVTEISHAKPDSTPASTFFQTYLERQPGVRPVVAMTSQQPIQQPLQSDKFDIAAQIVDHAKLITRPQSTEMIIKLKPEHLGELTFKVSVEQGVMSATFLSNNAEVRNIIETSLPQLKQELSAQGIKLDNVGVFAGMDQFLSGDQRSNQQYQQTQMTLSRKREGDFAEAVNQAENPVKPGSADSAVDYRI